MAPTYTSNWGLLKPDPSDQVNVATQLNDNLDVLDKVLSKDKVIKTGLDWGDRENWTVNSYAVLAQAGSLFITLQAAYDGPDLTADGGANFTDQPICSLPVGYTGHALINAQVVPASANNAQVYFVAVHTFQRDIVLVSGSYPGQKFNNGTSLAIAFVMDDANWANRT